MAKNKFAKIDWFGLIDTQHTTYWQADIKIHWLNSECKYVQEKQTNKHTNQSIESNEEEEKKNVIRLKKRIEKKNWKIK